MERTKPLKIVTHTHVRCHALLLAAVFGTLLPVPATAQVSTADILGTAFDQGGSILVGVKITATNLSTGFSRATATNESGEFVLPSLPVGHYVVKAEINGFKAYTVADVAIAEGDRRRIDLHGSRAGDGVRGCEGADGGSAIG
jgi:hypothetical protein